MPTAGDYPMTTEEGGWGSYDNAQLDYWNRYSQQNPEQGMADLEKTLRPIRGALVSGLQAINPALVQPGDQLTAQQAHDQYSVPGYVDFDQPVDRADAELDHEMAMNRKWHDEVWRRTDTAPGMFAPATPLLNLGAQLGGALTDPTNDALMMSGGVVGDLALGGIGLLSGEAAADATGISRAGQLWRGAAPTVMRSAAVQASWIGKDALLDYGAGRPDDFDMGHELANAAAFGVLDLGLHTAGNAFGMWRSARAGADVGGPEAGAARPFGGEPPASESVSGFRPAEVNMMGPTERLGGVVAAVDEARAGEPVDVGEKVVQALQRPGVDQLDETGAEMAPGSWRPAEPGAALSHMAVTARGTEVPIQYGLVEARDLAASHDINGTPNPNYPSALTPRDGHAPATPDMNDTRGLMGNGLADAAKGAPIISRDGVVEAGNGTVAALQRAAMIRSPAYAAYVRQLAAEGLPVQGMDAPVLVRMRQGQMMGASRAVLADEMGDNVPPMNEAERALSDARRISDPELEAITGGDDALRRQASGDLMRRLGPDEVALDEQGRPTPEGARRLSNAIMAKAYGDHDVLAALAKGDLRGIGQAMRAAAPAWARMRAAILRGDVPRSLDLTPHLTAAATIAKAAIDADMSVGRYLSEALTNEPMISGGMISPETEGLLRIFYRNEEMSWPSAADKVAGALRGYAEWASPEGAASLARRLRPESFEEFDRLGEDIERHRGALAELGAGRENLPEAAAARDDIEKILSRVNYVEDRLTKAAAARLADAQERLETALHTDTPQMTEVRGKLMEADYGRRELASAASRALRDADPESPRGGEFLRGYAEWAASQGEEHGFGNEENADAGTAARRANYREQALGWDARAGLERPAGRTSGAGEPAAGLGPGSAEHGVEGGEPRGGGLPQEGSLEPAGGGGSAPGAGEGAERQRADDTGRGSAGAAVPGDAGGEPAAGGEGGAAAAPAGDTARRLIAASSELAELKANAELLERTSGGKLVFDAVKPPEVIAEAWRAAAACLRGEV